MTPEERAAEILRPERHTNGAMRAFVEALQESIAAAIRAAVQEAEEGKAELLEALKRASRRACQGLCMTHEILSTSHHPDCMDFRAAIKKAEGGK